MNKVIGILKAYIKTLLITLRCYKRYKKLIISRLLAKLHKTQINKGGFTMYKSSNLKKIIAFIITLTMICSAFISLVMLNNQTEAISNVYAANQQMIISLQVDNSNMTVNGKTVEIDPGQGTTPLIVDGRTLVPIRAIIEAIGGNVEWDNDSKTTTLTYKNDVIRLVIDSKEAYLNDEANSLDVAPAVINGRTMLPVRFIAESFNFNVKWDAVTKTIEITVDTKNTVSENTDHKVNDKDAPVVYMTRDISSDSLMNIYNQLGFKPEGNVAIKLSTGEAGGHYYLDPNLIKDLVQSVNGTIVECNTAYGGSRIETAMHKQVAKDHGFTDIADVDIMDENGSMQIPVSDKAVNLKYNVVGANYDKYNSMIVLSHFKGHAMGGFGGAIKNISIGISSSRGKNYIHSGGHSETGFDNDSYKENFADAKELGSDAVRENFFKITALGTQDQFLESMAEAAQAVHNDKQKNGGIVYISVMNNISIDCDCSSNPSEPDMHDVGILASTDPVALDQACVDIVYNTPRNESGSLINRIEERNGSHTLEHAEKIGLGKREYNLVNID